MTAGSSRLHDLTQLLRPRLSAMVALAALSGYLAAPGDIGLGVSLLLIAGVFLLTGAASVFNQVQERERDRLMPRTCQRPLATGRMPLAVALRFAFALTLGGLALLACASYAAAATGLFALGWYNLLYTPLKSHTSLVLFIGALGGALPPLLGWLTSGASPLEPRAVHLYLLLILWQVPHFWCLSLRDGLSCQQAGLTVVPRNWDSVQLIRQIRHWSLALGALLLCALPLTLLHSWYSKLLLVCLSLWCFSWALRWRKQHEVRRWATATGIKLHLLLAGSLLLISIDRLIPL